MHYPKFSPPACVLLAIVLSCINSVTLAAADAATVRISSQVPSDEVLVANGATVGDIIYHVGDVFDLSNPKENKYFFRLANRLHINTKQFVIRDSLLFNTGDPYKPDLIKESERILRSYKYLYGAEIKPVRYHDNKVDIEVTTRDVWTLTGGVNYSRKGGENNYGYEIQEGNFLGFGKEVGIKRNANEFRTENEFSYYDPHIGSQRYKLTLNYKYNSDGRAKLFILERPFYSLETNWAMGIIARNNKRSEVNYSSGSVLEHYYQDDEHYEINAGYSRGKIDHHTSRWNFGYTSDKNMFSPTNETKNLLLIPADRNLSYPWIDYDSQDSRFIKTSRIDLIGRVEDINLGDSYRIKLGWLNTGLGADRNGVIYDMGYSNANQTFADHLLILGANSSGRVHDGFTQNLMLSGQARYFYPLFEHQVFYSEFSFAAGHHLDADNQILLGGQSGLRGYPARIQNGNRRMLFRMEQRYYTNLNVLQLVYVAGAAFFDIGRAWTPGDKADKYAGFLKDIGVGLRFSPSRTSRGSIIHLDLAFPLDSEEDVSNVQVVVATESRF